MDSVERRDAPSLGELSRMFLRLSLLGFGGPNAHIALMLDEVVERRGWLTREHFLQLVGVTNLLPGPNSSEVAIHIGYTQRGWRGALVTGLSFLAPTFVIVVALSALYFRYGALPEVEDVFWGLKPAIVAVVLAAGWKLSRAAVTDLALVFLAAGGLAVALFLDGGEVVAMAAGGGVGWLRYRGGSRHPESGEPGGGGASVPGTRPAPRPPGARPPASSSGTGLPGGGDMDRSIAPPGPPPAVLALPFAVASGEVLGQLFGLMLGAGAVLFGGGYMLIPLLEPYVVEAYGWLTPSQFLDGVALTQAVPGPIVTLVAFVGYAVAGVAGAAVATAGIYLPSFLAVLAVAPRLERWRRAEGIKAALRGVNAVVAGAIIGAGLSLVPPALPDLGAGAVFAVALAAALFGGTRAIWLILGGAALGLVRLAFAG